MRGAPDELGEFARKRVNREIRRKKGGFGNLLSSFFSPDLLISL
jgi:hypothetical protein